MSRLCEEFHCLPSAAIEEPLALMLDIISMRAYAQAKAILESAKSKADVPSSPMVDLVWAILADKAAEAQAKRNAKP